MVTVARNHEGSPALSKPVCCCVPPFEPACLFFTTTLASQKREGARKQYACTATVTPHVPATGSLNAANGLQYVPFYGETRSFYRCSCFATQIRNSTRNRESDANSCFWSFRALLPNETMCNSVFIGKNDVLHVASKNPQKITWDLRFPCIFCSAVHRAFCSTPHSHGPFSR